MSNKTKDKMNKRIATLINGDKVDLDELINHSGWKGEEDGVTLISKDGNKLLTTINVSILIDCWIAQEEKDYRGATK